MRGGVPPQRRQPHQGRGGGRSNLTPAQAAEEAERKVGRPCYYAGQKVVGLFSCVADQFRINNRGTLPTCPQCGELIWAYMGDGPRPVPEGEAARPEVRAAPAPNVQEGVKLETGPVKVEEGVKLEP